MLQKNWVGGLLWILPFDADDRDRAKHKAQGIDVTQAGRTTTLVTSWHPYIMILFQKIDI